MANIVASNLTTGQSETDASSYSSASITPTADNLILATIFVSGTTPTTPTVTGNGLTWVLVKEQLDVTDHYQGLFRALGSSPTSGAVTFDFGAESIARAVWIIDEFTEINIGGADGADAIVQSGSSAVGGSQTSKTITLGTFENADNATYGALGLRPPQVVTEGTGFSEVAANTANVFNMATTEFKATNDTTVDWSWGTTSVLGVAIAVEIRNATVQTFLPQMIIS